MFNERRSPLYARRIRMQKAFLIGMAGMFGCGVIASYMNFHQKVGEYTQSVAYREAQEASKEYKMKLMKRNQQSFTSDDSDPHTGGSFGD